MTIADAHSPARINLRWTDPSEIIAALFLTVIAVSVVARYGLSAWQYVAGLVVVLMWRYAMRIHRQITAAKQRGEMVPTWLEALSWLLLAVAFIAFIGLIVAVLVDPGMLG